MWRKREKGLQYWLSDKSLNSRSFISAKLKRWFSPEARGRDLTVTVREQGLELSTNSVCLNDALGATCRIQDGLGIFDQGQNRLIEEEPDLCKNPFRVRSVDLLHPFATRSLSLPDIRQTGVRNASIAMISALRSLSMNIGPARIHAVDSIAKNHPAVRTTNWQLGKTPRIFSLMTRIAKYPHSRLSADINALPSSEYSGFLREGEVIKGIAHGKGELLAVFRSVPIEMISRLRFLSDKRMILFTVARKPERTRTRIHDMAAIRDTSTEEIHLVPHRTRYRSVLFN